MEKAELAEKAIKLIASNFGEYTAGLYTDFYNSKDQETILLSLHELLEEIVGPQNAARQLQEAGISYNIKQPII